MRATPGSATNKESLMVQRYCDGLDLTPAEWEKAAKFCDFKSVEEYKIWLAGVVKDSFTTEQGVE